MDYKQRFVGFLKFIIDNDIRQVNYFLKKGLEPDNITDITGRTALFIALDCKNPEMIETLLKNGADPNLYIGKYNTPLGYFLTNIESERQLEYMELRIILLLLRYGANPELKINGLLNSHMLLEMFGYEIKGIYLTTRKQTKQISNDVCMLDDSIYNSTDIEFKDIIDSEIIIN